MKTRSSAHYQREYRKRLREQGLVKKEVWVLPVHSKLLASVEKVLRRHDLTELEMSQLRSGEMEMSKDINVWTTNSLLEAMKEAEVFKTGTAKVELVDGVEPSLLITMSEFGDLPVFLTVSGDQIIAESVLWAKSDVSDVEAFNEAVLKTHKFFPLSTISLDHLGDDGEYYQMFGALSSSSLLANVIFEIEMLASNVIQATEVYSDFLALSLVAGE